MIRKTALALALAASVASAPAKAEMTYGSDPATLTGWIDYYSRKYGSENDPHSIYTADQLWTHTMRVSLCETKSWTDFIGDHGASIGPMQMHERGIWWSSPQARAGYHRGDPEANIAAGAYFISRGYGPGHWVYCWHNGWKVQP